MKDKLIDKLNKKTVSPFVILIVVYLFFIAAALMAIMLFSNE